MGKVTYVAAATMAAICCLSGATLADEMVVKRHARKAVVVDQPVVRPACPDPYSCNSLYGAYAPYGGRTYWTRYVYSGWYR